MGFLDRFRKKKEQEGQKSSEAPSSTKPESGQASNTKFRKEQEGQKSSEAPSSTKPESGQASNTGKRVKRYTSEGKPVYE